MKGDFFLQACLPSTKEEPFLPFYTYLLGTSIFCLFLTILIYITSPELTNPSNNIIINFTVALFTAYLALIVIQRPEILHKQPGFSRYFCKSLGHIEQFSFLSAFIWMTIMSWENLNQLRGDTQVNSMASNPMKKQMLFGYGVPLLICLLTGVVDLLAPSCASYKPRFGQRNCFFYGDLDKFLWFYLPIIIMLIFNTIIFIYILVNICR